MRTCESASISLIVAPLYNRSERASYFFGFVHCGESLAARVVDIFATALIISSLCGGDFAFDFFHFCLLIFEPSRARVFDFYAPIKTGGTHLVNTFFKKFLNFF